MQWITASDASDQLFTTHTIGYSAIVAELPAKKFLITVVTKIFGQFEFCWLTVAVSSKLAGRPCQGHLCNLTSLQHQQNIVKIKKLSQYYKMSIKILSLTLRVISATSHPHQQNIVTSSPDSSSALSLHQIFWFDLIISTWISCPTHTVQDIMELLWWSPVSWC